jgi:hypothetical protein
MEIQKETVPEFNTGHLVVGTTAVAAGVELPALKYVRIKADLDNDDNIYVGNSANVTSGNGFLLDAGEHVDVPVDSLAKVFVIGGLADQGFSFLVV